MCSAWCTDIPEQLLQPQTKAASSETLFARQKPRTETLQKGSPAARMHQSHRLGGDKPPGKIRSALDTGVLLAKQELLCYRSVWEQRLLMRLLGKALPRSPVPSPRMDTTCARMCPATATRLLCSTELLRALWQTGTAPQNCTRATQTRGRGREDRESPGTRSSFASNELGTGLSILSSAEAMRQPWGNGLDLSE